MKTILALLASVVLITAGLASTAAAGEPTRIKTAAQFNKLVVGKVLKIDENHYTVHADGTFDGQFRGKPMAGTWKWKRKFWCRQLTTHSKNYDCQVWLVDGNQFTIIREKGKGKTAVLTTN